MGVDLRLSGLASGFDWKPVVEQLIELERIPQKRLAQEQEANNTKISELGILKSQLETLKSSAESLQSDDLYDARTITFGEDTSDYLNATAEVGTLAGEYKVSVHSLGTNTILTSGNLKASGVGKALDPTALLKDLPLQTGITEGFFTVESQTYEITQSDLSSKTLQQLLNEINADPENNGYPVTFEYDTSADRVIVDGGELNANSGSLIQLPILGHPNDSSNFLKVMRLLDGELVTREADQDNSRAFDNSQAWLRSGDPEVNTTDPTHAFGLPDSRNYTSFGGKLYQRIDDSATNPTFYEPSPPGKLDYVVDDIVYKEGFLYKCILDLPSSEFDPDGNYYDPTDPTDNRVTYDSTGNGSPDSYWELVVDPKNHVNSGATSPASEWDPATDRGYLTGDVVFKMDGGKKYFFQAVADSPATGGSAPAIHNNAGPTYTKYAATNQVESLGPGGKFYEAKAVWDTIANHASSTQYAGGDLAYDAADNQVYQADAKWDNVSAYVAGTKYSGGDTVYDASDDVYKASTAWNSIADHVPGTQYDSGDMVYSGASNDIYEPNYTLKADASVPFTAGALVFNGGKYYEASQNSPSTAWNGATNYTIGDFVLDGTTVWEAQSGGLLPDPSLGVDPAWRNATADVQQLSGGAFWTEVTATVEDVSAGGYWTSVNATTANSSFWAAEDTALNGADGYWANVNADVTNLSDTTYWAEYANLDSYASHDTSYWTSIEPGQGEESPGVSFWSEIGQIGVEAFIGSPSNPDGIIGNGDEDPMLNTDPIYWEQLLIPDPPATGSNDYWEEVSETIITSSQALGAVDVSAAIKDANLDGTFNDPNGDGTGSFFIGHGSGAVEIAYDVETDTLKDLIDRVNASDANLTMSYDPIGDQFILQSDLTGNLGITLNESASWDSTNTGTGNLLELMGLAADATTAAADVTEMHGVGRAKASNLGDNAIITINGGEKVFSQSNVFTDEAHGVTGLTIDVSKKTTGEMSFTVEKDITEAKAAVDKFIEEFNDAQKYINSLVSVTRDGDSVTAGRFSGSLEISGLGSQLRKMVFGSNYPHSASESTSDGTNKTVADLDSRNLFSFDADNDGYKIYVDDPTAGAAGGYTGTSNYQEWVWSGSSGDWVDFTPTYSAYRINDIGIDFQAGNDELFLDDSSLLIEELTDNPNKVKSLFSEEMPSAAVLDHNTGQTRDYGGLTYFLNEFIENFVESDSGAYKTHVESLRNQNERIDTNIDDLERYLTSREETLSQSFIRMEEMQSRMSTQLQTLQNSFKK